MPNEEGEVILSAAEHIPYAGVLFKVAGFVAKIMKMGSPDPIESAIEFIRSEIERINQEIDALWQAVERINERLATQENRDRLRWLREHGRDIKILANRLNPETAAEVAFAAGVEADGFLEDPDLWLFSDVRYSTTRDAEGQVHLSGESWVATDFKTYPAVAVYAAALLVFILAVEMECKGDRTLVQSRHGSRLRKHIDAIAVRPDWNELEQAPANFIEQVRSRITCRPDAVDTYARNGICEFSIVCVDRIQHRTTLPGRLVVNIEGPNALCTISPDVAIPYEKEIEANDAGIQTFQSLEAMLRQLETVGSAWLGGQFVGQFPGYSKLQQGFQIAAYVAAEERFLGAFPTFQERIEGLNVYTTLVLMKGMAGERRDIPLSEIGDLDLDNLTDAKFGDWMRAINSYASRNGFIGGFPLGWYGDYGAGAVCPSILIRHEAAEWRDVYQNQLGGVDIDDALGRFKATQAYATAQNFAGGFPNLFHAAVGGGPLDPMPAGIVFGTILLNPEFAEAREVFVTRMPA